MTDKFWATQIILGLTSLTFAGQFMAAYARSKDIERALVRSGHEADLLRFGAMKMDPALVAAEPWVMLSCVFVHFGIIHFGLNMLGFWSFARAAEPAIGSARLLLAYVAAGLAGSAATLALAASEGTGVLGVIHGLLLARRGVSVVPMTAGASGAVFGVMGLMLGWMLRRRDSRWKTFAVEAVLFGVLFGFAANAMPGSIIAVNNAAHLGGLACGIVFGLVYAGRGRKAPAWLMNALAALCLLACLASLLLTQLSPTWSDFERKLPIASATVSRSTSRSWSTR